MESKEQTGKFVIDNQGKSIFTNHPNSTFK